MKQLLILRHAKSSWKRTDLSDHERPLKKRGKRDAPRLGEHLRDAGLLPDLIITSDARRALETAKLVIKSSGYEGPLELDHDLYLASPEAIAARVSRAPDECERVMVVGHNPGMEDLLELLAGKVEPLPTTALAHLELEIGSWRDLTTGAGARLVEIWRPRERP